MHKGFFVGAAVVVSAALNDHGKISEQDYGILGFFGIVVNIRTGLRDFRIFGIVVDNPVGIKGVSASLNDQNPERIMYRRD